MDEVCRHLNVQPQTIYAYVSRGKLEAMTDPQDSRKSLYRFEDVNGLVKRKQAGRKHQTLAANTLFGSEPSIPTELSTFHRGSLYYRGQNAIELSRTSTLEDTATLMWDAGVPVSFEFHQSKVNGKPGRANAFALLADLAAAGHSTHGRQKSVLHEEAQNLVALVGEAFGAKYVEGAPLHMRFAKAWRQPLHVANLLRTAMVLLTDHELTSSAFATRIAASTGASLPACLLTGLTTLSGPLHGDASGRVSALFGEVLRLGEDHVVDRYLSSALPIAGFGHHIYPDGDPRAAVLLRMIEPTPEIARFIERVTKLTGMQPNIDIALAAMVVKYKLPSDAAFGLFATSRSVGLIAHCIEQLNVPQVIRPRGRYTGKMMIS